MIYHTALAEPAASLGWQVELFERKAVIRQLAELRGLSVQDCDAELQALGKPLGKPWGQEHRQATAAALIASRS